jgi:polar amino acid transport system substrate-binding protein
MPDKKRIINIIIALFCGLFTNSASGTLQKITLCTDNNFWYPFIYVQNGQVQGLHIDIINQALITQNCVAEYKPMSWADCQDAARFGIVDGIATISYESSRAKYLFFPGNAENTAKKSPWRISQADYVVVTSRRNTANISIRNENLHDVPAPIRLISSYSLVNDFQQKDIYVEQFLQGEERYRKLLSDKTGSIIDLPETALYYATQPAYTGQLFIHPTPIDSKSYYLAFSKQGTVQEQEIMAIWKAIVQVREAKAELAEWLDRY